MDLTEILILFGFFSLIQNCTPLHLALLIHRMAGYSHNLIFSDGPMKFMRQPTIEPVHPTKAKQVIKFDGAPPNESQKVLVLVT